MRVADFSAGSAIQHEWDNVWFIPRSGQTPAVILVYAGIGIFFNFAARGSACTIWHDEPTMRGRKTVSGQRGYAECGSNVPPRGPRVAQKTTMSMTAKTIRRISYKRSHCGSHTRCF